MPNTANTSAPPNVASAGRISSSPVRTMMIAISVATSEKNAQRRAHTASREVCASARRRRAISCKSA